MAAQGTRSNVQAVRRVYENGNTTNNLPTSEETIYIVCHPDSALGKDIILWDDILSVFSTALYIRSDAVALPFLKRSNFKNLDPLRIAAVPGTTLDVVVRRQLSDKELKELPMGSLQDAPPDTLQENKAVSTVTVLDDASTKIRRNPVGGLVEKAMDAYRDNENPAFGPRPRGPQAILDETPLPLTSNSSPTSQTSIPSSVTPSHQDTDSANNSDFRNTMEKAKLGDMDGQYILGDMYYVGDGVQQDYQAARGWLIKAANQGHVQAQNDVGYMYQHGLGVLQDYVTAMEWYRKAAHQGFASAQYNVGYLYEKGLGVPQDYHQAMEWYQKAASQGNAGARSNIGYLYRHGFGVAQDYSQAMFWYRMAAEQGYAIAQHNIAIMYELSLGVPKDLTKAIEWYEKAVESGEASSKGDLLRVFLQQQQQISGKDDDIQIHGATKKSGLRKRFFK
ncbi:hypothetical protein EC991_006042 [Linnemannia zychae]|nr:hypothetical protein EC991_006042 [Linnemannia zychae]